MAIALVISFNVIIQDRNKRVNKDDNESSDSDIPIIRSSIGDEKKGKKVIRRWAQHGEKKVRNLKNKKIFKAKDDSQRDQLERNWTKDGNK